ncbi:MAG: acyl-CoA dehydrogenase family protein [Pseudomonadales bacterium]
MGDLAEFRDEAREWLEENCPESLRGPGQVLAGGRKQNIENQDSLIWLERCAERGYTVPMWPTSYGGAGLSLAEFLVLLEEMRRIGARTPLAGMGTSMIGPTLLEFGTEDQKLRHLPRIASGEIRWCQGYSEPGAGSDLASLQTRAEDKGDHFVVNGGKIWTSLAHFADWMFCLVRTDPKAPKHEGISFVLFPMEQPGMSVNPLPLISGVSHFCQCFFDDVIAQKDDLVGEINKGWTVGKRLLQHERSNITTLAGAGAGLTPAERTLKELAHDYVGTDGGKVADADLRSRMARHQITSRAFGLTQRRTVEESESGNTPGFTTSIFKLYGANLRKETQELKLRIMGHRALAWAEDGGFSSEELEATRTWLFSKASSIAGGSNEVQMNIIAKRVLGLPD